MNINGSGFSTQSGIPLKRALIPQSLLQCLHTILSFFSHSSYFFWPRMWFEIDATFERTIEHHVVRFLDDAYVRTVHRQVVTLEASQFVVAFLLTISLQLVAIYFRRDFELLLRFRFFLQFQYFLISLRLTHRVYFVDRFVHEFFTDLVVLVSFKSPSTCFSDQ